MEADLITAPGDGLAPAILLTLGPRLKAQYLFNVPEGFSRFVLEHRVRPGLGLRAAFLTDVLSSTGAPGLIMRLRGEGHGQLEVVGPPGTLLFLASLRHFVHWRHPSVLATDISAPAGQKRAQGRETDYDDEHVAVTAVWGGAGKEWRAPEWLTGSNGVEAAVSTSSEEEETSSSSSEESGDGSGDSPSSDSSSEGEESGSDSSSSGSDGDDSGGKSSSSEEEQQQQQRLGAQPDVVGPALLRIVANAMDTATATAAQLGATSTRSAADGRPFAGQAQPSEVVEVGNRRYQACSMPGISLFARENAAEATREAAPLLGFLCHIKASNQAFLVASCPTDAHLAHLEAHPALEAIEKLPTDRVAGAVFMLGAGMRGRAFSAGSALASFPRPRFFLEHPGPGAAPDLGFLSSAKTTAQLSMVSQRLFPLPVTLRKGGAANTITDDELICDGVETTIARLTKLKWVEGRLEVVPQQQQQQAAAENLRPTTALRGVIDVASLHAEILEFDPGLQAKLDALRRDSKRAREEEQPPQQQQQQSNKRAAAALQARLRQPQQPEAAAAAVPESDDEYMLETGPGVTFLGTGSAEPSKHRGASSIYLRCGDATDRGLLLDCGEGAWGQLVRLHGPSGALSLVASLSGVWISHRHADHMAGVLQLLAQYPHDKAVHDRIPLLLVGPHALRDWLLEAAPAAGLAQRYRFVHCSALRNNGVGWNGSGFGDPRARWELVQALGMAHAAAVPVCHCSDAFGIVLRHAAGWSVVYSGDTQPCEALVREGVGATLLIHEATFEPALVGEARRKRHSTSTEAVDAARRMGAYRTILTHFSQRYPKFPEGIVVNGRDAAAAGGNYGSSGLGEYSYESVGNGGSVAVAFDGMCVPLRMLPQLPAVTAVVQAVLAAATGAAEKRRAAEDLINGTA